MKHIAKGTLRPFALGSIADSGTSTSSIMIMPVTLARNENFPSIFGAVSPFMPFSRMNPLISPASSFIQTTKTSATGELVIHVLDPRILYVLFEASYVALVSMPAEESVFLRNFVTANHIGMPVID